MKSRTHLEAAISSGRTAPATLNNLAWVLIHSAQPDIPQALQLIKKAMAVAGEQPQFLETRAAILLAQKSPNAAIRDLEKALAHSNRPANTHKLLAQAYSQIGDAQLAKLHEELAEDADSVSALQATDRQSPAPGDSNSAPESRQN